MKKCIYIAAMLSAGSIYAQENKVGINTTTPIVTLNVDDVKDNAHPAGLQAPRLTRAELTTLGDAAYTADHKGTLIYITDVQGGDTQGQRTLVTDPGYYYFDGAKWERAVSTGEYRNLYIKNGTLAGNRIVTQDEKTLTFDKTTGLTVFENTTNPPMQVIDGEQGDGMALMSDADGNAQWEVAAVPRIEGVIGDGGPILTATGTPNRKYTNAYITLPPGKWALHIGTEIKHIGKPNGNVVVWGTMDSSSSSTTQEKKGYIQVGNILAAGPVDLQQGVNNIQGAAMITIGGTSDVTLYFWFGITNRFVGNGPTSDTYQVTDYMKKDGPNTYLYAIRIVD